MDGRDNIQLGDITYFQVNPNSPSVFFDEIKVQVYDDDNFIYEDSIQILVGETIVFENEDFESGNLWEVGALDDQATAGIWERLIPIGNYENDEIVQPDEDHTVNGSYCFLTQNPVNPGSSPGSNDVDGGKTTLLSPIYDLSEYDGAIVSYWRWYTNNQGNNAGSDFWQVDVTFDNGQTWNVLEYTNDTFNAWQRYQYLLNDYSDVLTNQIRFRFVAEDIYYDGDNGSGGSLIEAAIDDFLIEVFQTENNYLQGDVNSDDTLDVLDVVLVINYILDQTILNELQLSLADMNYDSQINVQDIVLLVNEILN